MAKRFKQSIYCVLAGILLLLSFAGCGARVREIDYFDNLDKTVVTVDGAKYTLRYLALYIAYQESVVQEDALLYDPENPMKYWNIHTNGEFIRVRARNEVMDSAVHDIIFLQMAQADEVELDEEETEFALSSFDDFWNDLSEEQHDLLAGVYEDMKACTLDMALAQKYQVVYAAMEDAEPEEFDKDSTGYTDLRDEHDIEIDQYLWKGMGFGHITLIY